MPAFAPPIAAALNRPFIRFLIVGASLALSYSILTALATASLALPGPLLAMLIWLAMIPPGYLCQRRFAFRAASAHRHGLWLYGLCQLIGMGIAALAAALFARGSFWPDLLVFLAASALAAVVSFLVSRFIIFPENAP